MNKFVPTSLKLWAVPFALIIAVPFTAHAKVMGLKVDEPVDTASIMPEANIKSGLMPNLTVNFQLNSTLGPEETAYYAKIVEKMLSDMPKKIQLEGEERHLLSGSNQYDTLKVVAYLPPVNEEISDNPLNKVVKKFDISFELPREKKLERVIATAKTGQAIVVEQKDSYETFMAKVGIMKDGGDISASAVPLPPIQEPEEPSKKVESSVKTSTVSAGKVTPKKALEKPKAVVKIKPVELTYFDANSDFISAHQKSFDAFVAQFKSSGQNHLSVITQTMASPFTPWADVRDARVTHLKELLQSAGVDVSKVKFSFVHLKSISKQTVLLEI
tara:strand:- start:95794 stop:96780 length:987 start_codon:yes stop_codon:yes gene_type:complete